MSRTRSFRDYLIARESSRKLRYLTALLAKEVVLHSFPHRQHTAVLERMVEVLTITERRLERGERRQKATTPLPFPLTKGKPRGVSQ